MITTMLIGQRLHPSRTAAAQPAGRRHRLHCLPPRAAGGAQPHDNDDARSPEVEVATFSPELQSLLSRRIADVRRRDEADADVHRTLDACIADRPDLPEHVVPQEAAADRLLRARSLEDWHEAAWEAMARAQEAVERAQQAVDQPRLEGA